MAAVYGLSRHQLLMTTDQKKHQLLMTKKDQLVMLRQVAELSETPMYLWKSLSVSRPSHAHKRAHVTPPSARLLQDALQGISDAFLQAPVCQLQAHPPAHFQRRFFEMHAQTARGPGSSCSWTCNIWGRSHSGSACTRVFRVRILVINVQPAQTIAFRQSRSSIITTEKV